MKNKVLFTAILIVTLLMARRMITGSWKKTREQEGTIPKTQKTKEKAQ